MYVCMYVCVYVCMCMTLSDLNAANKTLSFISLSLRTRHCLLNEPCFIYFTGVNYLLLPPAATVMYVYYYYVFIMYFLSNSYLCN